MAESGRAEYLAVLKGILDNDPDPLIQEYARKAARFLYTSLQPKAPPMPGSAPQETKGIREPSQKWPGGLTSSDSEEARNREIPRSAINEADDLVQRSYALHVRGQTHKALPIYVKALELNPGIVKQTFARSVAGELTGKSPDEALRILQTPSGWKEFIDASMSKAKGSNRKTPSELTSPGRDRVPGPRQPAGLLQAWLSFFQMTEDFFDSQLEKANHEDTLVSVLAYTIAAVVIFLVNGFFQIQQITGMLGDQLPQLDLNIGMIYFALLVGTVILTPLGFYATVGVQYLGVRLFGGSGDFKSHAYLMSLVQVPATILGGLVSLLSLVPIIGFLAGLVGFVLSIYTIILTVRLVKAAHSVTSGKAIAGIIVPPLLLVILGGCLLMAVGSSLIGMLGGIG